jgi:hypothetical protein
MLEFLTTKKRINMKITELNQMENIVTKNKSLNWDGWDVIHSYLSDKGRTSKFGKYSNGKWYITRRFVADHSGWEIPDKFVQ